MYVDSSTTTIKGKTYQRHLLRRSYRRDGKVQHDTIANVSKCSPEEVEAIRLALRYKDKLSEWIESRTTLSTRQGASVGAVWLLFDMARQLGIDKALGATREGRLALWQVIARAIEQGSRLSAVRLAAHHAACDVLDLEAFDEDDLYANLDWLCEKQAAIEKRLFKRLAGENPEGVYLYDVTSSYLEGTKNELSAFGYNRDGKRGKKQIVIGLLCNGEGEPLSVEVFEGNTQDPKTLAAQIRKAADGFGAREVTFVGDRGMIKSQQVEALGERGFHYITAITKPQIEALLKQETLQMELFDEDLAEVETDANIRFILRRNPMRAEEIAQSRQEKWEALRETVADRNLYLKEHPQAKVPVALRKAQERAAKLKISDWVTIAGEEADRRIELSVDEESLAEKAQLDGCYVLKTDLSRQVASKQVVHDRYKDLAKVEIAFRTAKTAELEMRPVHVRLASRTRGHVFVVMLAYRIVRELARRWIHLDKKVQEGIDELSTLCATEILEKGRPICSQVPEPRESVKLLLEEARVQLPDVLPCKGVIVTTKTKLPSRRKNS
jgi:transposase